MNIDIAHRLAVAGGSLGAVAVALVAAASLHIPVTSSNISPAAEHRIVRAEHAQWADAGCPFSPISTPCTFPARVDHAVAQENQFNRWAARQQDAEIRQMLKPMCAHDSTRPGQLDQQQLRQVCREWHLTFRAR